jgi:hypothetical protein
MDPRIQDGLDQLKALITNRWPTATFAVSRGEDPEGIYLDASADVADTDEVMDVIADRLLALQVEEMLPIYVIILRPLARIAQQMREQEAELSYHTGGPALTS